MKRLVPLLIVLAACSDGGDGGRRVLAPSRLRIVSGDAQVGPVAARKPGTAVFRVYGAGDAASDVLPDTLIVEIQGTIQGRDGITGVGGNVELPPGTSLEFTVVSSACGAPYIASVMPDADARARTLWELPGARQNLTAVLRDLRWHVVEGDSVWGARCEMEVRLKVGTEFRADTSFVAYFQPGPITGATFPDRLFAFVGDTLVLPFPTFADDYGNLHPIKELEWSGVSGLHPVTRHAWIAPEADGKDTVRATLQGVTASSEIVALSKIGAGWTYEVTCANGVFPWDPETAFDSVRHTVRLRNPSSISSLSFFQDTAYHQWVSDYEQMIHRTGDAPRVYSWEQIHFIYQTIGEVRFQLAAPSIPLLSATSNPATEYVGDGSAVCMGAESVRETFRAPTP